MWMRERVRDYSRPFVITLSVDVERGRLVDGLSVFGAARAAFSRRAAIRRVVPRAVGGLHVPFVHGRCFHLHPHLVGDVRAGIDEAELVSLLDERWSASVAGNDVLKTPKAWAEPLRNARSYSGYAAAVEAVKSWRPLRGEVPEAVRFEVLRAMYRRRIGIAWGTR